MISEKNVSHITIAFVKPGVSWCFISCVYFDLYCI